MHDLFAGCTTAQLVESYRMSATRLRVFRRARLRHLYRQEAAILTRYAGVLLRRGMTRRQLFQLYGADLTLDELAGNDGGNRQ